MSFAWVAFPPPPRRTTTAVDHLNDCSIAAARDPHPDRCAGRRVLASVVEEVVDGAPKEHRVPQDGGHVWGDLSLDRPLRMAVAEPLYRLPDDRGDVERGAVEGGGAGGSVRGEVHARRDEDVAHEGLELRQILASDAQATCSVPADA